jgi:hypothetical protein
MCVGRLIASKAGAILKWASRHEVHLADDAKAAVLEGFGPASSGEDAFDAFGGLIKLIEVVDGRRPEATTDLGEALKWEGWIIGRI